MYIYIMGRGHSGSTILDVIVGNSDYIESVGELLAGLGRCEDLVCSCGDPMPTCPFWREIRYRIEAEGYDWNEICRASVDQRRLSTILRHLWGMNEHDPRGERLARATRALEQAITVTAGKDHLLDSSKTPGRALFILRYLPQARVIHLVRDPRSVMQSYVWRSYGRDSGKAWLLVRMNALWILGNLLCELIARRFPDRVVRIRYEDLRAQPEAVLAEIGRAFALKLDDVRNKLRRDESFSVGHNIGGNRIRHKGAVRFDPAKSGRRPDLPRWLKVVTTTFCWPLMLRYGYWPGGEAGAPRSRLSDTTA